MRRESRMLFGVLLTLCVLCWSGLSFANPHSRDQSLDSSAFRTMTHIQLDIAFERSFSPGSDRFLYRLAGPSSMNCTTEATQGGIETCVVTTRRSAILVSTMAMPATLAQH